MQKRIAGSILITLGILMALMPLAKATTQHYWWDSIYFFEDDTPYPHPDQEYYDFSRYDDWSIEGTRLYHCQLDLAKSGLVVGLSIGLLALVGIWVGAKIGGTVGAVVGGGVGLALGILITVVANDLLLDERGCIWWWISEDFLDWVELYADTLYYLIINDPITATILITTVFSNCGYFRAGLITLFDPIGIGNPRPPTLSISVSYYGGTTDPAEGTYTIYGESVTVTATACVGYTFSCWVLDGVPCTDNPITVTLDSDPLGTNSHTLTAYFRSNGGGGGGGPPPRPRSGDI